MLSTLKSVASLLLSFALLLMANGLFGTLLGVRTEIEGFSTQVTGFIMAGYFAGLLLGGRYAAHVVASVGHIRSFAAFASVMSASALIHVMWIDPVVWFLLRIVSGLCMAGMIMVSESWLNERASNEMRGRVLAFYMITNYLGSGCGQLLLPLADPQQFHLFSVASIIFSIALVPILLTRAQAPIPTPPRRMPVKELYAVSPLGVLGVFSAGLVNAAFHGMAPVFAKSIDLDTEQISWFMASAIFGGLIMQWPIGRLSDRFDRRWVLVSVTLLTTVASIGIALCARLETHTWLYAATAAFGAAAFTVYSVSSAHINDFAEREKLVQVASGLLVVYGVAASVGPILAATAMSLVGPIGMFAYIAVITAGLGSFAVYRMRRRATKSKEERFPFVIVPATQFTSEELYTAVRDSMDRDLARLSSGLGQRYNR